MYALDSSGLATVLIEDHLREARLSRLARELQRHDQPSLTSAISRRQRRVRLFNLIRTHRAYS
jgi:hypothetical protein